MGCYHPLKGFPYGSTDQGRTNFIVTSYRVDHIEIDAKGAIRKCYSRGISANTKVCIPGSEAVEIPCGQCIGCRLDYSSQWASRCVLEMQDHKSSCFITLTYDDKHVPANWACSLRTRKEFVSYTLDKRDLQLFWKRLRKAFPDSKIRYYAAGEYGDETARPHYHAIVFGLGLDDLIDKNDNKFGIEEDKNDEKDHVDVVGRSKTGYTYYSSTKLEKIWDNGNVLIAEASWESAAYVARYVMKKRKGFGKDFYDEVCIEPEFVAMSRKPGIGYKWFDSSKRCYAIFLRHYIKTANGSRGVGKIRYFDQKLDEEYPFDAEKMKMTRQEFSKYRNKLKLQQTSLSYLDLLEVEEEAKENQTRVFKRIAI